MEMFGPIFLLLFVWLCIGLPLSLAKKQAARKGPSRPAQQARPAEPPSPAVPEPPVPERPVPERPVPLTTSLTEPDHDDSVFSGSMGSLRTEGFDPCHDGQLKDLEPVCRPGRDSAPAAEEASGLPLGWTPNEVVRGIVMSEILNRKKR